MHNIHIYISMKENKWKLSSFSKVYVIVVKAAKMPIVVAILFAAFKQRIRMKNCLIGLRYLKLNEGCFICQYETLQH